MGVRQQGVKEMVFFRADSNSIIAGGHITRCLAISKALVNIGEEVHCLVADENPASMLKEACTEYTVLNSDWQDLMSDAAKVKEILLKENNPILLIDTYSVTKEYIDYLKPFSKIVYLGSKPEYLGDLDLLINYSTDIDFHFYRSSYSDKTRFLLGPSFAPLREEFQNVKKPYRDHIERILLTTGNTDKDHMVDSILKSLLPVVEEAEIVIDIVIGRMFEDKESLYDAYSDYSNLCFHEHVKSMSLLMKSCDLAISANGTTVYELCAVGLPAITFAMVPEQEKSAEAMSALGIIAYCGPSYADQKRCLDSIRDRVVFFNSRNDELLCLGKRAHALIDGNGCKTIAEEIMQLI